MLDLTKLADDGVAALGKLDAVATKVESAVTTGGPEAVKILEEVKAVLGEIGPVLNTIMPLIAMLSNFFPHATPAQAPGSKPAGAQ